MIKLLIASNNPGKLKQWRTILADTGIKMLTLKDLNLEKEKVIEDGKTAEENALKKARYFYNLTKIPTIGDDAGIHIDALNGLPGVKARRWNGLFKETVDDETWLAHLLKQMQGVPFEKRTGKIIADWALVSEKGEFTKEIIKPFVLLEKPIRPYIKGFPISALHYDAILKKPLMEIPEQEIFLRRKKDLEEWNIKEKI